MNINNDMKNKPSTNRGLSFEMKINKLGQNIEKNNTQTYRNDHDEDYDQEEDDGLLKDQNNNINKNNDDNTKTNKSMSTNKLNVSSNKNENVVSNQVNSRSSSMKNRNRTTSGKHAADIFKPLLSNNVSRSSSKIEQHKQQNDRNHDNKHETTFIFRKNRSISHNGYNIYENNDQKEIVDIDYNEDEEQENKPISSPKLRQKSIMNDIVDNITCEGAVAGAIIAGVPMHGTNITNLSNSTTNNKTGSSTLSSSSTNESSSFSSSSKSDNLATSSSTSDLSNVKLDKENNFIESQHLTNINLNKAKIYNKNNQFIKQVGHDDLKIIILDDKTLNKSDKRDSIRMRHYSSASQQVSSINKITDARTDQSFRSRLKKISTSEKHKHKSHKYIVIFLLFVVNLLNYIDRYTLAGVLPEIQKYFDINDGLSGLLQTVFICSYMLLAPLFGYLGDRYSRKWIIIFGISFWSLMTFLGSFMPPDKFWLFAIIRSLVGIGEASYSCVAPTIIGDLFTNELRTKMLALFYLAVPVGSGMGYIVGSNVASLLNNWKWALRITPPLGLICIILLIIIFKDPKRGGAEGTSNDDALSSSMWQDLKYLIKNKTFLWITWGFTFASFVLGGLSWWVPTFVQYGIQSNNQVPEQVSLKFGVVTCLSGLLGVAASSIMAAKLRSVTKHADPLVCALGSLIAVPSLFILILITRTANQYVFWLLTAVAITAMCLSWTIVADILLYTILPSKRSIASAFNILICHLFGDAGSPYVIGLISDSLRAGKPDTYFNKFTSLQLALYAGPFFAALSFACYLFAAIYVDEDKKKVDDYIKKNKESRVPTQLNSSNEITSNENSQKDDESVKESDDANTINMHKNNNNINSSLTTNNEINSNLNQIGKTNQNFTDSKIEIVDMESTSSVANLLNRKD